MEFTFKMADDETYSVTGYSGNEADVVIPDRYLGKPVTVLFDCLFRDHPEIRTVHIPDTVTDIGEFVFDRCTGLSRLKLPANLTYIWQYAFVRSGLEEIALPEKVRSIAPYTFKDCRKLRSVICNDGLSKVFAYAFSGCDMLTEFIHSPGTMVSPQAFDEGIRN